MKRIVIAAALGLLASAGFCFPYSDGGGGGGGASLGGAVSGASAGPVFYGGSGGTLAQTSTFTYTGGKLGLGTASPSTLLHLSSGAITADGSGAAATISGTVTANLFSGPVKGTATNDSASAGNVGEVISSTTDSGHTTSLTNTTPANIVSMSLTAGDWDVSGVVDYVTSGATTSDFKSGASATSATFGAQDTFLNLPLIGTALSDTVGHQIPLARASLSATTTIYLIGQANFSVGTATAYGTIRARRVR